MGRTWYAPWSSASAYALPILAGAKMTQMENRIVLTRFKDGYGPVGAYFLHLKTYTQNAYGQEYESTWFETLKERVGDYVDRHPVPTCLRNHALLEEVKAGRGPIRMVTTEAFKDPHKETVGWENFLGMTIGQAVVWASQNIDPKEINPELTTSEPYVMGSHATCSGAWASCPRGACATRTRRSPRSSSGWTSCPMIPWRSSRSIGCMSRRRTGATWSRSSSAAATRSRWVRIGRV